MRPFEQLTPAGQVRRLRLVALEAAARYPWDVRLCSFVARSFNSLFRLDAADGSRFALRVGEAEPIHAEGTEQTETGWLAALRAEGTVAVPGVVPTREGQLTTVACAPGVPGERLCTAFDWIEGRPLRLRPRPDLVRAMGRISALLHEHAARHAAPGPPRVLVADRVLYWRNEPRLDELIPVCGTILLEAVDRAQRAVDALWRNPPHLPHLVHGDLGPSNVMVGRDRLVVIDFQDLFWGFEVQDLAITIGFLLRYPDPRGMVDAFRDGYREVRPWPDLSPVTLDALIAARDLHQLNLGLNLRWPGLEEFVAAKVRSISSWMGRPTD
jgi:Ser/Thr protein kinase RdoA (MazF antagonist)